MRKPTLYLVLSAVAAFIMVVYANTGDASRTIVWATVTLMGHMRAIAQEQEAERDGDRESDRMVWV